MKWSLAGLFFLILVSTFLRYGVDANSWILYLANNTVLWIPDPRSGFAWTYPTPGAYWGLFVPLFVPLMFYLIFIPFGILLVNIITAPGKIEKGEKALGKAYVLNREKNVFKEIPFKKGETEIEHNGRTYKIDSDKFVFLHQNPISRFFLPKRTPFLYYDSARAEALDIEYVRKSQKFKKFNPVEMALVVRENLTQGFFKSLVIAAGRRVVKVRYIVIIFIAIAALVVVLNYYFPDLFRGIFPG